ncbi:MAG: fumarylacetoacetate hydrolase family protein [Terriglobia bacterium]
MNLYRTEDGPIIEEEGRYYEAEMPSWDALLTRDDLSSFLADLLPTAPKVERPLKLLPPIVSQEVWAAGVTYYRSRNARMEESKAAGGGSFYDRVYSAERPELFFKATPHRVVGHEGLVAIREDSHWSVPEPELALVITPHGQITGYTIGNDMSARDIEGDNPMYLPQAKVYDRSCALGPGILISSEPLPKSTEICLEILRGESRPFSASTTLAEMKREPAVLVKYLFRHNTFPNGCFLMTGTGIVPPDSFTLKARDEIRITIEPIGTLVSTVG